MTTQHTHMVVYPEGTIATRTEPRFPHPDRYAFHGSQVASTLRFPLNIDGPSVSETIVHLYTADEFGRHAPNLVASLLLPQLGGPLALTQGPVMVEIPDAADAVWATIEMYAEDLRSILTGGNPSAMGDQSLAHTVRRIAGALSETVDLDARYTLTDAGRGAVNL